MSGAFSTVYLFIWDDQFSEQNNAPTHLRFYAPQPVPGFVFDLGDPGTRANACAQASPAIYLFWVVFHLFILLSLLFAGAYNHAL